MSSSDWSLPKAFRRAAAVFLVLALPLASACTVKPLYSNPASDGTQAGVTADLSSIAIKPVEQRYAQQVRNHLIFLFNGGAGQPAAAAYTLTLVVTALHQSAAVVQVGDDNEPTAGTVTLTARYVAGRLDQRRSRRQRPPPDHVVLRRAAPGIRRLSRPPRRRGPRRPRTRRAAEPRHRAGSVQVRRIAITTKAFAAA